MLGKIVDFFKKRPGLVILILILSAITVVNIKPDFYLLGWDNYSSYFNLNTNIFRTFFSTWREYRGLGVPSDAEATDIFRQIFYWFAHFIIPEQLLDQVYYMFALWVGILSMYGLAKLSFNDLLAIDHKLKSNYSEIFAFLASFVYLFNLNTLSIFYSPIIPFTNRFYSLPLTIYLFIRFINSKKRTDFLLLALVVIITSGSYITPTLIITTLLALIIFFFFWVGFKKTVIYSAVFLLLNSFWLFPFFNYTVKKSPIIPLARTFIEINESTLNQPKTDFSLYRQSMLYPSFFNIKFPSLQGNDQLIHPLLNDYQNTVKQKLFLLFPFLYLIGGSIIIFSFKKNKRLLWLPMWIIFFLFLSTKQYGPLGFLYNLLEKNIPYFGIIFRIGDTKFHAYINIAGSILSTYALIRLYLFLNKKKIFLFLAPIIVFILSCYGFLFRSYFTGDLINNVLYAKIPKVYFDVAKTINNDKENNRVLHLPFDNWHHYWRSYSWGYLGSAFYNFLLDKPYIDKTFEPGSMENSYLHTKLNSLISGFYRSERDQDKEGSALRFLDLLEKTGIRYIILDDSISSSVYPKNINYTARQSYVSAKEVMDYLYNRNLLEKTDYNFPFDGFFSSYERIYPINKVGFPKDLPKNMTLSLYKLRSSDSHSEFVNEAVVLDNKLDNLAETNIDYLNSGFIIQKDSENGTIYPLLQQNHSVKVSGDMINIEFPNEFYKDSDSYKITTSLQDKSSVMIDIFGQIIDKKLNLDFYHRYYPDINGKRFQKYLDSMTLNISEVFNINSDNYRLMVDGVSITIPEEVIANKVFIDSVIVHSDRPSVNLLVKKHNIDVDISTFENRTTLSNCQLNKTQQVYKIKLCNEPMFVDTTVYLPESTIDKQFYFESNLVLKGETDDQSQDKYTHSFVCISQTDKSNCLNLHRNLLVGNKNKVFNLQGKSLISSQFPIDIQIGSIPFDDYKQALEINSVKISLFEKLDSNSFDINYEVPQETVDLNNKLEISLPKALSNNSFYFDNKSDFYDKTTAQCGGGQDKKRIDRVENGVLINSMESCLMALAQIFDYYYRSPYLLIYDYWIGSGQQPLVSIKKKSEDFLVERTSLYQGYPKISGMRNDKINLTTASRIINPDYFSDIESSKIEVNFFQDTINQGKFALGGINMVELPSIWYGLQLTPSNSLKQYYTSDIKYEEKSFLPSLWKIEFENNNFESGNTLSLLRFNEGFDKDWGLYDNLYSVLVGKPISDSIRCDGYINCFEITNLHSKSQYFVFYWPERLYLFGWFLTVLTIIFSLKILSKEPLKTE